MIIITLSAATSNSNAALRQEFRKLLFQMIDDTKLWVPAEK